MTEKRTPMKRPAVRKTAQVTTHRSLDQSGEEVGSDSVTEEFKPETDAGDLTAEATGNVGMTLPTDIRFEMLRIDVGGRLPCSPTAFRSGEAHDELFEILRKKFKGQHERGKDGL